MVNGASWGVSGNWSCRPPAPSANGDGTAVARRPADLELARQLHKTIRRVTEDIEAFKFNTMVAALMEFANELGERYRAGTWQTRTWDEAIRTLLVLLAPAAPHVTAELWERIGQPGSVHEQPWPTWDEALVRDEQVTVVVQVDGKVRDRLELPAAAAEEDVQRGRAGERAGPTLGTGLGVRAVALHPRPHRQPQHQVAPRLRYQCSTGPVLVSKLRRRFRRVHRERDAVDESRLAAQHGWDKKPILTQQSF